METTPDAIVNFFKECSRTRYIEENHENRFTGLQHQLAIEKYQNDLTAKGSKFLNATLCFQGSIQNVFENHCSVVLPGDQSKIPCDMFNQYVDWYMDRYTRTDYHDIWFGFFFDLNNFKETLPYLSKNDPVNVVGVIRLIDSWAGKISVGDERIRMKSNSQKFSGFFNVYLDLVSIEKVKISEKNEACFIATVCYGDYNAAEVLVFRQFRDDFLLKSVLGRSFVNVYYWLSPPIARCIEKSQLLKQIIRKLLDLITKLIKGKDF